MDLSEAGGGDFAAVDEYHGHLLIGDALDELRFDLGLLGVLHEQVLDRLLNTASLLGSRRDLHFILVRLDRGVRCQHRNAEQQGVLPVREASQLVEFGDVGALGYERDVLLFEQLLNSR